MADIYSTTPSILANKLVTLEDPKNLIAAQNVIPLITKDKASDTVKEVLNAVSVGTQQGWRPTRQAGRRRDPDLSLERLDTDPFRLIADSLGLAGSSPTELLTRVRSRLRPQRAVGIRAPGVTEPYLTYSATQSLARAAGAFLSLPWFACVEFRAVRAWSVRGDGVRAPRRPRRSPCPSVMSGMTFCAAIRCFGSSSVTSLFAAIDGVVE